MGMYDEWATAIFEKSGKTEEGFRDASRLALMAEWEKFRIATEARVQAYWDYPSADLFFKKRSRGGNSVVELLFRKYPLREHCDIEMSFCFRANGGSTSNAYFWTNFSAEEHKLVKLSQEAFEDFVEHKIALLYICDTKLRAVF